MCVLSELSCTAVLHCLLDASERSEGSFRYLRGSSTEQSRKQTSQLGFSARGFSGTYYMTEQDLLASHWRQNLGTAAQ